LNNANFEQNTAYPGGSVVLEAGRHVDAQTVTPPGQAER
jgi:hypothetical protein